MKSLVSTTVFGLLASLSASAAITDNIVVYYNFDATASGNGALIPNILGSGPSAMIVGTTPTSGFAGNAAWNSIGASGAGNTSDRSTLLVGKSANFSRTTAGSTDRVTIPISTATLVGTKPVAGAAFSISAWYFSAIDPNQAASQRYFIFEDGTNSTQYHISFGSQSAEAAETNLNMYSYNNNATTADVQGNVSTNAWHNVVQVFNYNGTSTTLSVYRDGVLQNSTPYAVTGFPSFSEINLGNARNGQGRGWDGMINEVAIWNRSLSAAEATDLYNRGSNSIAIDEIAASFFSVQMDAYPVAGGAVVGSGNFLENTIVLISATANLGYIFSNWTDGFADQPASFDHTVIANVTSTAQFAPDLSDPDHDNLTTYDEVVLYGTDPNNADSDGDGSPDDVEIAAGMDPNVDDSAFVAFVSANLCPNHTGAITMTDFSFERDPSTGEIHLKLNFHGSVDQTTWAPIDLNSPPFSLTPVLDGWEVTLPAPSSSVNSYILLGTQP